MERHQSLKLALALSIGVFAGVAQPMPPLPMAAPAVEEAPALPVYRRATLAWLAPTNVQITVNGLATNVLGTNATVNVLDGTNRLEFRSMQGTNLSAPFVTNLVVTPVNVCREVIERRVNNAWTEDATSVRYLTNPPTTVFRVKQESPRLELTWRTL